MKFAYELLTADGKLERGSMDAASEGDARRQLTRQGQTLLELRTAEARVGGGRIPPDTLLLAFTELATLLRSGLGIAESIASIAAAHREDALGAPLEALGRSIGQGKSFAESMAGAGLPLPAYFLQLARAGEMTGRLADSLDEASAQFSYERELATELRNALIYPAVLVASGVLAVGMMFAFVVPRFAGLLEGTQDLPWLARAVLVGGQFVNGHALLLSCLVGAAAAGATLAARRPRVRDMLLEWLAGLPLVGGWLLESATASWAALLGALLGQGVPMLDALELASDGVRPASRRRRLQAATRAVRGGLALSRALEEQGALSTTAYNLLRTGERAGQLPEMLKSLAALSARSGRNRMKRVLLLIEPLAILLIGGAIGTIVLGIVLAITSLSDIPV